MKGQLSLCFILHTLTVWTKYRVYLSIKFIDIQIFIALTLFA